MISIERSLLGAGFQGDAIERHKEYAKKAGKLDVIVLTKQGFNKKKINQELTIYPTNSKTKLNYIFDAYEIAKRIYWPDKFDLIVTQDPFLCGLAGWLIKKRFKTSLLVHFHGDFWKNKYWLFERKRWWFNWFFLILSRFLVKKVDGVRVVSSGIKDKLIKKGIKENKIRVIPTPVDLEKFKNYNQKKIEKIRKEYKDRKVIINIGRKDPSKDYKTLYKTISLVYKDYKKIAFLQIGNGDYLQEKIKADENLILTSIGRIDQKELINYYYTFDVYVSSSCHESFGKVLIEAMACSLPVVATATTGSKEIIKDGENGFLVPIGDSQALAKKILFLLNNPERAEQMGKKGQQMVKKRFDQQKIIKQMTEFWKDLSKND